MPRYEEPKRTTWGHLLAEARQIRGDFGDEFEHMTKPVDILNQSVYRRADSILNPGFEVYTRNWIYCSDVFNGRYHSYPRIQAIRRNPA